MGTNHSNGSTAGWQLMQLALCREVHADLHANACNIIDRHICLAALLTALLCFVVKSRFRRDRHHKLTFQAPLPRDFQQCAGFAAQKLLELLRQLAGQDNFAFRENFI